VEMTPGPSQPLPACILYICVLGNSPQHSIIIIVLASLIRILFMLVFHQNILISAIKRTLCYYLHVCILVFIHVFVCSLLLQCMLKRRMLHVGVKTLNTINNKLSAAHQNIVDSANHVIASRLN